MKTVLITGATGFLGKHLIETLRREQPEAKLRVLARGHGPKSTGDRFETVRGDICHPGDVASACLGVDEIYHAAGVVEREPADAWKTYRVHVEGTRNVCEAMLKHGVPKAVFVSTSGVMAVGPDPVERDETAPYAQDVVWDWPYYVSKIYAEKLALWYVEHKSLPIVHVNPSLLLGPGDDRRSSTRDVELFLEGEILVLPTGGLNLVDVRDAAEGLVAAMSRGRVGERYLLGGPNMTFHEWIQRTAKISGVSAPKFMLPVPVQLMGARLLRAVMPLIGKTLAHGRRLDPHVVALLVLQHGEGAGGVGLQDAQRRRDAAGHDRVPTAVIGMGRAVVILNPKAAGGRTIRAWPRFEAAVRQALGGLETLRTERPGHGIELARRALSGGAELVIAVGGDGTANEVVNGFFEGGAPVRLRGPLRVRARWAPAATCSVRCACRPIRPRLHGRWPRERRRASTSSACDCAALTAARWSSASA